MNLEGNLRAMFENLEQILTTKTVFGEPIKAGDTTLIPVVTVTFGLGTGGGGGKTDGDEGSGGGAGAGVKLVPRAIVAVTDGQVNVFTIGEKQGVSGLIERVPELVSLIAGKFGRKSSDGEKNENGAGLTVAGEAAEEESPE